MKIKNSTLSEQFYKSDTKIDTINTQIYDRLLSLLGKVTSIKSGGFKLILWYKISFLSEMMGSYKCFPHASKMPTLT
jgi:hypothetical protein